MIPLLEARRLSAEFCGVGVIELPDFPGWWIDGDNETEWTPDTNAEQMAECMEAVINAGWYLHYHRYGCSTTEFGTFNAPVVIEAPLRECAMYAAAELQRRKG